MLSVLLLAALAAAPAASAADPAYADELVAAARGARLADDPQWRRLLHYRPTLLGGLDSEADGPTFFTSPRGRSDPEAELEGTIRSFFAPPAGPEAPVGQPQRVELLHPQCRFPARLSFVARRLGLDVARLPLQPCPRFEEFWRRVQARSATLVFSSYYLNNPASAFGHTFLRLNKQDAPGTTERYELLDQGIDYAAAVDTPNALVYAVKGLTGLFRGEFTARPYFYKVREYADYESRDLWEYDLDLAPDEVAMLVAHLWELGGTWFDYWYLTENCSYHILAALEAAAPRVSLLARVHKVVIPADTVKAVTAEPGLVRAIRWRPSIRTQFLARAAKLSPPALGAVEGVSRDAAVPLPAGLGVADQALTLDAAADLVDIRHGKAIVKGNDPDALALRQALLERRSTIPFVSPPLDLAPPPAGGPDRGHGSMRLSVGGGAASRGGALLAIEGRIALHDLADPPAGFSPRTRIEFLRVRARYSPLSDAARVDEAWLVDVASLNAIDRFEQRFSWRFRFGAEQVRDAGCPGCLAGKVEFGGGPAHLALGSALSLLASLDAEVMGAPRLSGVRGAGVRPGFGPTGLVRLLGRDRAALLATAGWRWFPAASPANAYALGLEGRIHLGQASLAAELRRTPVGDEAILWTQVFR
jgi:hypothetical protein